MERRWRFVAEYWGVERSLTALLVILVTQLFIVTPILHEWTRGDLLNGVMFAALAIAGTSAVTRRLPVVLIVATLGISRILLDGYGRGHPLPPAVLLADLLLRAGIVILLAAIVTTRIFRRGDVTHHRVQGAVVIYLLAALLWAHLYEILDLLDPDAFRLTSALPTPRDTALFRFFSFETLTTLGYGDVLPVSSVARTLVSGEALFGQLFPAVMITRLVSLEFAERSARKGDS